MKTAPLYESSNSANPEKPLCLLFVHSLLDDARLSPGQFRVFAAVTRRAGSGTCWAALDTLAETCCMDRKTVRQVLRELVGLRLLKAVERPGQSRVYTINPVSLWKLAALPESVRVPPSPLPETVSHPYQKREGTPASFGTTPLPKTVPEGYPLKEIPEINPPKAFRRGERGFFMNGRKPEAD